MNIAECKKEIAQLEKNKDSLYVQIMSLDKVIDDLNNKVASMCAHPADMLLTKTISHEDEYGKHVSGWDEVQVMCIICNKSIVVPKKEFTDARTSIFENNL